MWWIGYGLTRGLVPPRCVACDRVAGGLLCAPCTAASTPFPREVCAGCSSPRISKRPYRVWTPCNRCDALDSDVLSDLHISWAYGGAVGSALRAAKLGTRIDKAISLAGVASLYPPPSTFLAGVDVVVPVAPSPKRLSTVGYDVVTEIAAVWAKGLGIPLMSNVLRRKGGPSQTHVSAHQRRARSKDLFEPGWRADRVRDKRVLLVDDVRTTGATLGAVASLLKELQVSSCVAWAVCGHISDP